MLELSFTLRRTMTELQAVTNDDESQTTKGFGLYSCPRFFVIEEFPCRSLILGPVSHIPQNDICVHTSRSAELVLAVTKEV